MGGAQSYPSSPVAPGWVTSTVAKRVRAGVNY
jgi:hypothetical protein